MQLIVGIAKLLVGVGGVLLFAALALRDDDGYTDAVERRLAEAMDEIERLKAERGAP